MEGVTDSEYLGTESVDGVSCHRCRFVQPELTWDIWIEVGDRPVVHKVVPDMSGRLAEMTGGPLQDAKFDISLTFTDWDTSPDFADADFAFTPPESAEEVDSFFEAMGGDDGPHPLLGQPAPPFETVDLAGQPVNLQDHLHKDVVILDFWATWCGPCVQALPIVAGVAEEYKDRGVVFYAVDQEEDAETISEFLAEEQLDVPVAMDADSAIGDLYGVDGIPHTVVIGKDGKVQVVHVGFTDGMEKQLSTELDDLLAGKDLAGPALAKAEEKAEKRSAASGHVGPAGTTLAWTVPGGWTGVATDAASHTVFAIGSGGKTIAVDADGAIQRELTLDDGGTLLRLADLVGGGEQELVTFEAWGAGIRTFAADGTPLWDYPSGQGIDDVWAADLNGDGRDEVIVGYNGSTGLHVVDHQGTLLWKNTELGNVWHVSAGDFNGDGAMDVVTTSALGALHGFDADGNKLKDIHVAFYANMVRMDPAADAGGAATAIVTGSGDGGKVIQAVEFNGVEKWSTDLPGLGVDHVVDAAVAGPAHWAAVAMRGGLVHVVDLETGQLVACATEQGTRPQVTWLPRPDASPLLVVATGNALNAFEVTPTDLTVEGTSADDTADAASGETNENAPPADASKPAGPRDEPVSVEAQ